MTARNKVPRDPKVVGLWDQALDLRNRGLTYRQIGAAVGCAHATARERVLSALKLIVTDSVLEMRAIEGERLDLLQDKLTTALERVPDNDELCRVALTLIKLAERRARLFGLDSPERLVVSGKMTLAEAMQDPKLRERLRQARKIIAIPAAIERTNGNGTHHG